MKQIVITVSAYYLDRIDVVAKNLREEGVTITRLYEFGVIVDTRRRKRSTRYGNTMKLSR